MLLGQVRKTQDGLEPFLQLKVIDSDKTWQTLEFVVDTKVNQTLEQRIPQLGAIDDDGRVLYPCSDVDHGLAPQLRDTENRARCDRQRIEHTVGGGDLAPAGGVAVVGCRNTIECVAVADEMGSLRPGST